MQQSIRPKEGPYKTFQNSHDVKLYLFDLKYKTTNIAWVDFLISVPHQKQKKSTLNSRDKLTRVGDLNWYYGPIDEKMTGETPEVRFGKKKPTM